MLVPYRIEAQAIADLTDGRGGPVDDCVAQTLAAAWKTVVAIDGQVPPSWTLAQNLIAAGAEGALVPSAQNRAGIAMVLWRWREDNGTGNGAVRGETFGGTAPGFAVAGDRLDSDNVDASGGIDLLASPDIRLGLSGSTTRSSRWHDTGGKATVGIRF